MCYEHNVLSAALRWSAGWKSFSARLSSLGRKILFHPAGSLSFQLLPTLSSGAICQDTVSLVENCCRTAWARVPCHRQRNNPAKLEKGTQVLRPVPNMRNKNVKNSDSSHRLALSLEHSRMFRLQGDSLLKSLYLLWERKRDNKT